MLNTITQSLAFKIENRQEKNQRFLNRLSLMVLSINVATIGWPSYIFLTTAVPLLGLVVLALLINIATASLAFWWSRELKTVDRGSWLLIAANVVTVTILIFVCGSVLPLPGIYFSFFMLSFFLLPIRATIIFSTISIMTTMTLFIIELNGYVSPLFGTAQGGAILNITKAVIWFAVLMLPTLIGGFLFTQYNRTYDIALEQASLLNQALKAIENKRQISEEVSTSIKTVTSELNNLAKQQAIGSQQQALAIKETTNFVRDLTLTARTIAINVSSIYSASENIVQATQHVKDNINQVAEASQKGFKTVTQTVTSNEQVSQIYLSLVKTLSALKEQSKDISQVIEVMGSISDETRLLSLNAAIEAAGAGEYGDRFGVVANEVKSLADRSVKATKQVGTILNEVENRIDQAVAIAASGKYEAENALRIAQVGGKLVSELSNAIFQNLAEMVKIEHSINTTTTLTKQIQQTTNQQHHASDQVAQSLEEISTAAQQVAGNSSHISDNAHNLEKLSYQLTSSLAS